MSFLTGTSAEVLYKSITNGTQLNTFTTEASLMGGLPHCIIPAGFFMDPSALGKSLKVKALMRIGTTGTPTMTFSVRLATSTTFSASIGLATAAITMGSGVTLAPVELELEIVASVVGAGGGTNSTLRGMGTVRAGTAFAAGGGVYSIPAANTAFTMAFDHTVTQYLFMGLACGTSNAANLGQLEMLKVWGEN